MRKYFLTSARLGFDLWSDQDVSLAIALWGDPAVMRLAGGPLDDRHQDVREIGYHLRPPFWRQGLAREAAEAVAAHGFSSLHLAEIHAGHHPENDASRRILEGLGFRYTHHEFYPPTQVLEPCYSLSRGEFRSHC